MNPLHQTIADLVTEGNQQEKTDVVILVKMFEMPIRRMAGPLVITMLSSNALKNSNSLVSPGIDFSYKENLLSQTWEGCNLEGFIQVNKVSGNFHVAPGRSFAMNNMHVHDTVSPIILLN